MSSRLDDLILRAQALKNQPKIQDVRGKMKPRDYSKDFGNEEAELMIIEILLNKGPEGEPLVEAIERGTKREDQGEKVDFWIKFKGVDEPIGIQYTISENENKVREKEKQLADNHWMAEKEKREDSIIKWSGRTNVVFVRMDKIKIAGLWKESQEKKVAASEIVDNKFVIEIYKQIIKQLDKVNPYKKNIFMELLEEQQKGINKKAKGFSR